MSIIRSDPGPPSLLVDGRPIPLELRRHHAARRLKLRYDPASGALRLTLPPRASAADARAWAAGQAEWIRGQLAQAGERITVGPGTELPFDGEMLTIRWEAGASRTVRLADGALWLGGEEGAVGRRVQCWLMRAALDRFTQRSQAMASAAGLPLHGVAIGDPRSRWGSCSSDGRIRYSWRLIMAPTMASDSVIAHEVAHLAHMDHSPRFYRLAASLYDRDPVPARSWLRRHGRSLHQWHFG